MTIFAVTIDGRTGSPADMDRFFAEKPMPL